MAPEFSLHIPMNWNQPNKTASPQVFALPGLNPTPQFNHKPSYNPNYKSHKRNKEEYNCLSCNSSFTTISKFENHIKSHIKCKQCDFEALGRVISEHVKTHHKKPANQSNSENSSSSKKKR